MDGVAVMFRAVISRELSDRCLDHVLLAPVNSVSGKMFWVGVEFLAVISGKLFLGCHGPLGLLPLILVRCVMDSEGVQSVR